MFVGSYPPDTVGMVRAANEVGLNAKLFGGGMVGLQATAIKTQLGPLLNGIVDYDFWLPVGRLRHARGPGVPDEIPVPRRRQRRRCARLLPAAVRLCRHAGVGTAVEGTNGTDQAKLADYLRTHTFHTIVGDIKFGPNGEWAEPRVLEVQFHGVQGHDIEQFRNLSTQTVLFPPALKTGELHYPYTDARK